MPFDHNHHYHPLLLAQLPPGPGRALDVGCGSGRFARRLAAAGLNVDAIDRSAPMIRLAEATGSPGPGVIDFRRTDITTQPLPAEHYSFISCLASLHHVPFETVTALREALEPGGVLAVLGLARPSTLTDHARQLAAAPVNAAARLLSYAADRLNGGADALPPAPVYMEFPRFSEIRAESQRLLPGSTVRPLLFWRYLLTYRKPLGDG
jgi:SAM-dependent methyltransferase